MDFKKYDIEKKIKDFDNQIGVLSSKTPHRSILEYESYATKVNGVVTDWQPAIVQALTELSTSLLFKTLLFPTGVYPILTQVNLTSVHNGITIIGEGYSSEIKIADGATQNWMFNLLDNTTPLKGISIRNIRLNGNKANTGNAGTTGFGIFLQQGASVLNEHIFIENVWAHDFLTTGINIFSSNTTLSKIYTWNNNMHGLGLKNCVDVIASDINSHNNGGYGIDLSGGELTITNFICRENGFGGMKTSNGTPNINLNANNGKLVWNDGVGFQTTLSDNATFFFDNIETSDNGLSGFNISEGKYCVIGKLVALRNNRTNVETNSSNVGFKIPAQIDTLIVKDGKGYGVAIESTEEVHIKRAVIEGNTHSGVWVNGNGGNVNIESGRIYNNCTTTGIYGILGMEPSAKVKVNNLACGDTNTTKKQTRGVYLGATTSGVVLNSDFRDCTGAGIFDNGATTLITKNNLGYVTEKTGNKTSSGNGSAVSFTIAHGLSITPNYISVIPSSVDARGNFNITADATNITVTYATAPITGTNNLAWFWEAKYNK